MEGKKLVEIQSTDAQILSHLQAVFLKNLQEEDELNKEVEKLLEKYEAQITGDMDRRKMFQMIKKQLVKERKLTI